jgi:hypothetical protein
MTDRTLHNLVNQPQRTSRQLPRPLIHPRIQLVGRQLLKPDRPNLRNDVPIGHRPVIGDRRQGLSLEPLAGKIIDRIPHGVAQPGCDASLQVIDNLTQLVLDLRLGPALALDPQPVALPVKAAANGPRIATSLRIDWMSCVNDLGQFLGWLIMQRLLRSGVR